jgi:hypothetical protein
VSERCKHCGARLGHGRDEEFCSTEHRAAYAARLLAELSFVKTLREREEPAED